MHYQIKHKPSFSVARVEFEQPGEQLVVEAAAMVAKDTALQMKTQMRGGMLGAAKRKLLGGESLFQNTFTATEAGQSIWVAPPAEGDIIAMELGAGAGPVFMSSGNYIASGAGVSLDTEFKGAKGFFSGTSLFMLRADGQGPLFLGSYGGIHEVEVGPQGYICDNNHIVAFEGTLDYSVRRVGGIVSLVAGGEGIVCEFRGQGKLWVATRGPDALARFVHPFRRVQSSSS